MSWVMLSCSGSGSGLTDPKRMLGDAGSAEAGPSSPTPNDAATPPKPVDAGVEVYQLPPHTHAVSFSPAPGTFVVLPDISLTASSSRIQLYYTLDGSLPSLASTPYAGAIAIDKTTLVRVAAYQQERLIEHHSGNFIAVSPELSDVSSNLPVLVVHMLGGTAPKPERDVYLPAIMQLHDRDASGRAKLASPATLTARASLKVHGRRSRTQDKRSYSLEIRADNSDEDNEAAELLDLPPQSDWVLYAPYTVDRALIRNPLFYQLSRNIGRYAPWTRFVELYMADADRELDAPAYLGVYVLTESVKRDAKRVAIQRLGEEHTQLPAISGGYIVRIDEPDKGEILLQVEGIPRPMVLRYPSEDQVMPEQTAYIESYLNAVGRAVVAVDKLDPVSMQTVSSLADLDSFIDYHILTVFSKNPDALRLSTYMHKDRAGKLFAGPVWDCDRCMGSYDGRDADPEGWSPSAGTRYFEYGWWPSLFAEPSFEQRYWARLAELLKGPLSERAVLPIVDELASELDEAAARNALRYPEAAPLEQSFRRELEQLKSWLGRRIAWLRANNGQR